MGLGVSWYRCPECPLGFLPYAGATPPSASSPLGFCTLGRCVSMSVSMSAGLLLGLGWWGLCYVTWFSPLCHALPQGLQPSQLPATLGFFPVTGCLSFSFPGGVGWASALPFFFWASPAPLACWGRWGFAPCVRVLQLRWCLLGSQVRSPCYPSLTLG